LVLVRTFIQIFEAAKTWTHLQRHLDGANTQKNLPVPVSDCRGPSKPPLAYPYTLTRDRNSHRSKRPCSMDNSGDGPLQVPAFTDELPREFLLPIDAPAFSTAAPYHDRHARERCWYQDLRLTARELGMLDLMSRIMDEPDWAMGVFQDDFVGRWKEKEATDGMLSDHVWNWCVAELRDKAAAQEKTGFVLALDSGSRGGQRRRPGALGASRPALRRRRAALPSCRPRWARAAAGRSDDVSAGVRSRRRACRRGSCGPGRRFPQLRQRHRGAGA